LYQPAERVAAVTDLKLSLRVHFREGAAEWRIEEQRIVSEAILAPWSVEN
jgi:hypothetical protein